MSISNTRPGVNKTFVETTDQPQEPPSPQSLGTHSTNHRKSCRTAIVDRHPPDESKYERPLSIREGTSLDERVVTHGGDAFPVGKTMRRFERHLGDKKDSGGVALEKNGNPVTVSNESRCRFFEQKAKRRYAKIMAVDRHALRKFNDPHLVLLTLTGDIHNDAGGFRAPVDFANDLLASNNHVNSALHYVLEDYDRAYHLKVIAAHESGYPHVHIAVWVDGAVSESDFHSVVDKHTKHSPVATEEHHDYSAAIRVESARRLERRAQASRNTPLAKYVGGQIMALDGDVIDAEASEQLFAATMWASNTQTFSPSTEFNKALQDDDDAGSSDEWEFIGMVDADGHIHEVDNDPDDESGGGGGKSMVEIRGLPESVDPVG